ncbi:hypothetical protein SCHPADRAFT_899781 [Schizopora paradoxa]|uniref:Amidohydrolase 3 domain-containing protein n=1 Tax=Schizopora paradoxa TaxID=27342 RepID=A0A0H2S9H4_9AGAM|nr:hypothetical protein SCHPADRAFT_899781 [Schizopora paradoxa]
MALSSTEGAVQRTTSLVGSSSSPQSSSGRSANGHASKSDHSHTKKPPQSRFLTSGFSKFLVVSAVLAYFSWKPAPSRSREANALPDAYVLCSRNGPAIYTVDEQNRKVSCLAVNESRIFDTGDLDSIQSNWLSRRVSTDSNASGFPLEVRYIPEGAIILPGMSDSHGHTLEYGASRQLPLEGAKDVHAAVRRVRDFIRQNPEVERDKTAAIEGWGWDHTAWPGEELPTSADLEADPVIRGRPVILQSKDGHALWLSPTALQTIKEFPDTVEGGIIARDEQGIPTGVLLDKAQDLLKKAPLTEHDRIRRFNIAVNDALSKGLTTFHDAGFDPASLAFFKRQASKGNLPVRIYGMTYFNDTASYWGDKNPKIIDDNRLTARSVKIFADGALRSGGAALYEPYDDHPETHGFMRIDMEVLSSVVPRFLKDGWQVNIHAIGDRANGLVLDVLEAASKEVDLSSLRPRIEHAQIILERDLKRMAKLGVIASIQPTHAVSDMWYAQDRLGPERVKNLYAFRSMLDNGVRIAHGSDFPVEDMNPLAGFYAAVTRLSPDGRSPHGEQGWFPEQRLTRLEALRGMTIDPAYASFTEDNLGSLIPGKLADFVVLSQDIMEVPVDTILETTVLATALDGKVVHGEI